MARPVDMQTEPPILVSTVGRDWLWLVYYNSPANRRLLVSADPKRRRPVRSCNHNHRTAATFGAQLIFEKRAHFAIALANQRDYGYVGIVVARHGSEEGALANAAAAEDSNALSLAAGQQPINRANAGDQGFGDVFAIERARRGRVEGIFRAGLNLKATVDGPAESV